MTALFVTATGTDIGKTFVTAGLIRRQRQLGRTVEALKPVISGYDGAFAAASDSGIILTALGRPVTEAEIQRISPWRFTAPLSPDMAARREGRSVDFEALLDFSRRAVEARTGALLIEGVGGIMSPLDDRHTVMDWMVALDLPIILVAGSYLGTISHTLSALDALDRRNLKMSALVVSETKDSSVALDETAAAIARFAPAIEIVMVPRLTGGDPCHPAFDRLAARF